MEFTQGHYHLKYVGQLALQKLDDRVKINEIHIMRTLLDPSPAKIPVIVNHVSDYMEKISSDIQSFTLEMIER